MFFLESIEPEVLWYSSGKLSRSDYAEAVAKLLRARYSGDYCETYILDTCWPPRPVVSSVKETRDFVHACEAKPNLAEFSPIPGTLCFDEVLKDIPALACEPLLQKHR